MSEAKTETKKLSKAQKAIANQLQKDLLQPIVKHNIDIQKYGEPCINARTLLKMWDSVLFADNPDEFIFLLKLNLIAEHMREIHISLKTNTDDNLECDTSRLYIGLVVKNYKEMCKLLNEKATTGGAKIKQIENWKRFFDFEKINNTNEYIVLDIYPEPFPKGTKRNTQFTNQLVVLILRELIKQKENDEGNIIYYTTYTRLIKKINIVNQYFHKESLRFFISKYPEWFKLDSDFEKFKRDYNLFKILTKRKIKGAVQSTLVNLKKDNLIYYTEYHRIKFIDNVGKECYRNATIDEEIYIQSLNKEVAETMGYRNSNVATLYEKEKFNELFTKRLQEENGWDYVFYQLEIGTKRELLQKHISEYTSYPLKESIYEMSANKEDAIRLEYNNNLSNALIEQAENMADTKIKSKMKKFRESNVEYDDMTDTEIIQIFGLDRGILDKYGSQYIDKQKTFINYLISFDKERIHELMNFYSNQICKAEDEFTEDM